MKILISKFDYNKIGSRENAPVFGIENETKEFFNPEIAIKEYNNKITLNFGFAFCIFGFILLYFDIRRIKKKKIEEKKTTLYTQVNRH